MPAWCIKYPNIHMHLNSFYLFKDIVVNYVLVYPRASLMVKWQFLSTSTWCSLHIISIIYSQSEADDGFLCPWLGLWFVHRNHQRPWCFQGHWKASLRQGDGQAGAIPGQGVWSIPAGCCGMGLLVEEEHHTTVSSQPPPLWAFALTREKSWQKPVGKNPHPGKTMWLLYAVTTNMTRFSQGKESVRDWDNDYSLWLACPAWTFPPPGWKWGHSSGRKITCL